MTSENQEGDIAKKSPLRGPLVFGLCTALLYFFLLAPGRAPATLVDWFDSGRTTELDLYGGSEIELLVEKGEGSRKVTAEVAHALEERGAIVGHVGSATILLELPGTDVVSAQIWADQITAGGELAMHMVIEDSAFMKQAYRFAKESLEMDVDIDQWMHDETGAQYVDYLLRAESRETLEWAMQQVFEAGIALPPNTMIGYEQYTTYDSNAHRWRTYLLSSTKELGRDDVADASVVWNQYSNKPDALIEFSREGGRRFGELTGANVGKKLAILVDDEINSAPTIQTRIAGGSCSISMGSNDLEAMDAEARALVGALRGPELPASVDTQWIRPVEAGGYKAQILLAQGLMALFVGLCIGAFGFVVSLLLGRISLPISTDSFELGARVEHPWHVSLRPLLVSLGAILATLALGTLWLPGAEQFLFVAAEPHDPSSMMAAAELSWVAIGLGPFLTGAVLAEGLAFLIPPWRRRRGVGKKGRTPIDNLALVLGLVLLGAQGFFIASWLGSFGDTDSAAMFMGLDTSEFNERAVLLALVGGSAALYGLAKLVSRYGLGNGFAVVIMAGTLPLLPDIPAGLESLSEANAFAFSKVYAFTAMALVATWLLMRRASQSRSGGKLALPFVGVAPIVIGPAIVGSLMVASRALEGELESFLMESEESLRTLQTVGIVLFTLILTAFALRKPRGSSELRVVSGAQSAADSRSLVAAIAISLAFPVAIFFLTESIIGLSLGMTISLATLILGLGLLMDLWCEFRARFSNPELTPVWELQQPRYLLPLTDALELAGIPYFVRGRYLRTLLSVLGPFVPMVIMVSKEHAGDAHELIMGQLGAPEQS